MFDSPGTNTAIDVTNMNAEWRAQRSNRSYARDKLSLYVLSSFVFTTVLLKIYNGYLLYGCRL